MPKRNALFPKITVRCPATSANLGPGFDIAGMALSSPSDLMVFEVLGERAITIANSGKYDVPSEADKNTLGPVIRKICADHLISDGFKITIEKNIKPASGLGSSAATAAGAAVALNAMYGLGLSKKELIAYASLGEEVAAGFPHADNVSPAIMGGIVLSSETTGRIEFAAFPTIDLDLLVILPGKDKGSTKIMREAIPDRVDWKDARANMQAVSLLFEAALDSSPEKFIQAVHRKDLIVEKARATVPALSHLPAIQALGDEYGFGVFASGSGPAVIAACLPSNKRKEEFARGALDLFAKQGIGVETNWAKISGKGVEIVGRDGKISEVRCIECGHPEQDDAIRCSECSGLLEVAHNFSNIQINRKLFSSRNGSGVWRFKELVHPTIGDRHIVSRNEGNTFIYTHKSIDEYAGISGILLKHEGENPTGSFKDRGMTVAISEAMRAGAKIVACASTGNTSASMSSYASLASIPSTVFIPEGKIAVGKLSQSLAYGAKIEQVKGNFDSAMEQVQKKSKMEGLCLLNSINPWRIEGQKTIIFELLMQLRWEPPDWIVVPAGNLGNTSAFGKALKEAKVLGLIEKVPRLLSVQAEGAAPFYRMWIGKEKGLAPETQPETIATAIRIGNPISWPKALRAIKFTNGIVEKVSDQEIMDAKAAIDGAGIGCEPASAATIAGVKKLVQAGIIKEGEKVVCILTGNLLKDPDATIGYHKAKLEHVG